MTEKLVKLGEHERCYKVMVEPFQQMGYYVCLDCGHRLNIVDMKKQPCPRRTP